MFTKLQKNRGGFTLVEIMIVVAIIALLAAIAVPNFMRARKRAQATLILNQLKQLDSAIDQYAIEFNKSDTSYVDSPDLAVYIKKGSPLYNGLSSYEPRDALGNYIYMTGYVGGFPFGYGSYEGKRIFLSPDSFAALEDVAPAEFWSPFSTF